jgi:hypothetical protein
MDFKGMQAKMLSNFPIKLHPFLFPAFSERTIFESSSNNKPILCVLG